MSSTITTNASIASFIPNYWDRMLGDNLRPNLYMYDLGEVRKLPANFGTTIKIPRVYKGGSASRNIVYQGGTEGAATATCPMSSTFVSGTLKKFRGAYQHSDLVVMTALSDVIQLSLEDISFDLAKKMDTHIQAQLSKVGLILGVNGKGTTAGTFAVLSGGTGSMALTDVMKPTDLIRWEVALEARDNPRYPGTNKYALVIHPYNKYGLITSTSSTFAGWIDINKYNNAEKIFNGEIGSLFGFKVIASSNVTISAGLSQAALSHSRCLALAPRAYYVTELSEMTARTYVKQLGSSGSADPTNDICTVGAKVFFTAVRGGSAFAAGGEHRQVTIYATIPAAQKV